MSNRCPTPIPLADLIAYHFGELPEGREHTVEVHVFECHRCAQRLVALGELGHGVQHVVRHGWVSVSVTRSLLERAARQGVRLREYTIGVGGSVNCTAGPTDDFVVIRMEADLRPGEVVDMEVETPHEGRATDVRRVEGVLADQGAQQIIFAYAGDLVRSYPDSRWTITASARSEAGTVRPLGTYTLCHSRWRDA